jgi:hypothetical protein
MATGCASTRASIARATGEHDMAVSASPGPDLVGTWRGRAWVLAGTVNEFNSVAVDLTIKPDGTWSWSTKGQEQGHGRVAVRGNGVTLHETWSRHGNTDATNAAQETIVLKRTGDELWGVTRAFMPSAQNAVELKRVAP